MFVVAAELLDAGQDLGYLIVERQQTGRPASASPPSSCSHCSARLYVSGPRLAREAGLASMALMR